MFVGINTSGGLAYSHMMFNLNSSNPSYRFRAGGDTKLCIDGTNDRVGILTTSPSALLDVFVSAIISGTIKLSGFGSETCAGVNVGTMRFNRSLGVMEVCQ